jgi:imidazolonepropionase-like amidohydrolase
MPTVLEAAAVVDVEQGRIIKDAYVLVDGEKIKSWGSRDDLPALAPDTTVLAYPRHTLLPGLINSHAHLCMPSGGQPFYADQTDEMALLTAVRNMGREQRAGITTVRDCGDRNGVLFSLRRAVTSGILDGPRLVLCGPPLTMTGGHADFLGGVADGELGITTTVRQRIAEGADFIKLIGTGGGTPGTHPGQASYSRAELSAAVAAAHRVGIPVAVHCRGIPGIVNAIEAGVDHIEHACFEKKDGSLSFVIELAEQMASAGIYVTPTIQLYRDAYGYLQGKSATEGLNAVEQERLERFPGIIEEKFKALRGFLSAGVPVVAGNDAGLPYTDFGCLWQELDAMLAGGITAMQALEAATLTAARALGMGNEIGSIQTGKQADLFIVDDDPTIDISALSRVSMVMQAGRIVFEHPHRLDPEAP